MSGRDHFRRGRMIDRGIPGFQLDLFAAPERIAIARGGAVHPLRRRMAGQLPRRRKRRSAGDDRQLQLSLGESGGALTPPGRQNHAIREEKQHGKR